MKLVNEYISQSILCASNNLRLSSEKIESVTLFRKYIETEPEISAVLLLMKQKTELSKLAVKLSALHVYISKDRIDFINLSERFKEHCHHITPELGAFLDITTPSIVKTIVAELVEKRKKHQVDDEVVNTTQEMVSGVGGEDFLKDDQIEKTEFSFEDYEEKILTPIKSFDSFLSKLPSLNYTEKEIMEKMDLVKLNADLSMKIGFDILSEMHDTFFKSLKMIHEKKLVPTKEIIESMRACLIVVVAVVRRKDVDISKYLKRAEAFGRNLNKNGREII
ncbi:MAG: hypothetical protein KKA84_13455 [Bacteroidetes bacterium]|nr:hypothetical protein [Bacteroidota bacterium]